jgi:hypothetical protein
MNESHIWWIEGIMLFAALSLIRSRIALKLNKIMKEKIVWWIGSLRSQQEDKGMNDQITWEIR